MHPFVRITILGFMIAGSLLLLPVGAAAQVVTTYATGLEQVWGLAFDPGGNLYVSGMSSNVGVIHRIPAGGGPVTLYATGFGHPRGVAVGVDGDLYVADLGQYEGGPPGRIWRVPPVGPRTVFAGGIAGPHSLGFDAAGNLLVSEWTGRRMRSVSPMGVVRDYGPLLGGTGEFVGQFVIDAAGDVYVGVGSMIKRLGPGGSPVTTFASGLGGVLGLARGAEGEFFTSRYGASDLWIISPTGAGSPWTGGTAGCIDGLLADAKFGGPRALASFQGRLYIADRDCGAVRMIERPTPVQPGSWGRVKAAYHR